MAERLRGRAGQAQRIRRLKAEPLCRRCAERGLATASTVPDHILPLALGGSDEDSNIRCLCGPCHDEVTAEQFGHRTTVPVGAEGWPVASAAAKVAANRHFPRCGRMMRNDVASPSNRTAGGGKK